MRCLSVPGRFAGILAWHSFFHLPPQDQRLMFPAFGRLAAAGGALMFTSGAGHGEAIGTFEGEALHHASLDREEYAALLRENGFRLAGHVEDDAATGGATVWLARKDLQR